MVVVDNAGRYRVSKGQGLGDWEENCHLETHFKMNLLKFIVLIKIKNNLK